MRVIGWEPCEATWWLTIRQTIAKPWPRDAVLMDLRFWKGQELATADKPESERIERPGRPALSELWGWTDWNTRSVMKSEEEWGDPKKSSSTPPVRIQRPSNVPPVAARLNADKIEKSSSVPPASLQRPSSTPPRARSILTDPPNHLSPITVPPPTPSFDSTTVADPAVNEEEEDNSQQNPEDSCTQQPKSMIEPEQTMDPNDYNHDEDIDAEIAAFLEEQKRIGKQNEQGTGVEPAKDPLENVGRYLTDPDYTPSLWKNLADRRPKEKVRDIVPLEELPPDPELDAILAEHWKSRVTDDTIGPLPSVRDTMREIAHGTAQTTPPPAPVAKPVAPVAPQGANLPRWLRQGPKVAVAPAPVAAKPQLPKVPGELMVLFTSPTKEGEMGMTPSDAQRLIVALVQNEIRTSDVLFSRSRSELKMMRGVSAYNERIEAYLQRAHGIGLAPDYRNRWDVIVSSLARHDDMNHLSDNERSAIGAMGLTWPRMKAMSTFELSRKAESFVDEMRLLPRVQTYGDMYNK